MAGKVWGRYVRHCLVHAMYLSASVVACLAWVCYNKLMFTFYLFTNLDIGSMQRHIGQNVNFNVHFQVEEGVYSEIYLSLTMIASYMTFDMYMICLLVSMLFLTVISLPFKNGEQKTCRPLNIDDNKMTNGHSNENTQQLDVVCLENVSCFSWKYTYKSLLRGDIVADDIDTSADASLLTAQTQWQRQTITGLIICHCCITTVLQQNKPHLSNSIHYTEVLNY